MTRHIRLGSALLLRLALLIWWVSGWLAGLCVGVYVGGMWGGLALLCVVSAPLWLMGAVVGWSAWRHGRDLAAAPDPDFGPMAWTWWHLWWTEVRWVLRLFGWRLPFQEAAQSDARSYPGLRGVLFIHGYGGNRGFWAEWQEALHRRGHASLSVSLDAVNGSIEAYAPQIELAVEALEASTGLSPLVVTHGMGGVAVRAWWRWQRRQGMSAVLATERVHAVVTIACPHQGSALTAWGWKARQLVLGSDWLRELAAQETAGWRSRFVCIRSDADITLMPPSLAILPDARVLSLSGCGHWQLAFERPVRREVLRLLQENLPVCVSSFSTAPK
ncbi:esterase/lipase family protein [Leptothrix ochracea]|uniref:esterase/lipase family protein n=1 Tax=Leptothrix ochracea TaxID=735331 RepID=UPI0034E22822